MFKLIKNWNKLMNLIINELAASINDYNQSKQKTAEFHQAFDKKQKQLTINHERQAADVKQAIDKFNL